MTVCKSSRTMCVAICSGPQFECYMFLQRLVMHTSKPNNTACLNYSVSNCLTTPSTIQNCCGAIIAWCIYGHLRTSRSDQSLCSLTAKMLANKQSLIILLNLLKIRKKIVIVDNMVKIMYF